MNKMTLEMTKQEEIKPKHALARTHVSICISMPEKGREREREREREGEMR